MRALILSDIHCVSRDLMSVQGGYHGVAGSSFYIEERSPRRNPILAIGDCLLDQAGTIDALLCLGDFAHQSKKLPFLQSWADIKEIAETLKIPFTIGITGNHDIASRVEDVKDAEGRIEFLQSVGGFPFSDKITSQEYFSKGVCSIEIGCALFIAIDTCRTHGYGKDEAAQKKIWSFGHVTDRMIDDICTLINDSSKNHIILMMHHHPEKVHSIDDPDSDQMENGPRLMAELARFQKAIFVLHGHKHLVRLKRASNGMNPPIILSAASLAAYPYPGYQRYYANQFHILEIDTNETRLAQGRVFSWDWGSSRWEQSKKPDMPYVQPFGPIISLQDVATKLTKLRVISEVNVDQIKASVPEIAFISASEIEDLNKIIAADGYEIILRKSEVHAMIKVSI